MDPFSKYLLSSLYENDEEHELEYDIEGNITALRNKKESMNTITDKESKISIEELLCTENNFDGITNKLESLSFEYKAIKIEKDFIPENYNECVNEEELKLGFETDIFQKQAFYYVSKNESIFVTAHTSSGKTLIADYALFLSAKNKTKAIYTSPIKALSNQKYYEFKQKYDVGILTGDVQINTDANSLIMTTEILRNMLYKNTSFVDDVEFIIFDEVHYINDESRGVVWEECLIMLPGHITIIMLSATVSNEYEFADWVAKTRKKNIHIISTKKRVVPLEHYIFKDGYTYTTEGKLIKKVISKRIESVEKNTITVVHSRKKEKPKKIEENYNINVYRQNSKRTPNYVYLVGYLMEYKLFPAIFFCFSQKRCEEVAKSINFFKLINDKEREEIKKGLKMFDCLKEEDKELPQIEFIKSLLLKGVGVHHSSLLPIVKEVVEILFSKNLIKILFATETFAMGVNMPARSVVFLTLRKRSNDTFRYLLSSEYTQMSGRAGRRGRDKLGTVIIAGNELPPEKAVRGMIYGNAQPLKSKFKISFEMVISVLRTKTKVEDVLRMSFGEAAVKKRFFKDLLILRELENKKDEFVCKNCNGMNEYINLMIEISKLNQELIKNTKINIDKMIIRTSGGEWIKASGIDYKNLNKHKFPQDSEILESVPDNSVKERKIHLDEIIYLINDNKIFTEYNATTHLDVINQLTLKEKINKIKEHKSLHCPTFKKCYEEYINQITKEDRIKEIKDRYSDSNLNFIYELYNRIDFLRKKEYIDENRKLLLKGEVASEIKTLNTVFATELLFGNKLKKYSPNEIISILSSMINTENFEYEGKINTSEIENDFTILQEEIEKNNIPLMEELNFSASDAILSWCEGRSFREITTEYKIPEGYFVRLILRLDECCRELIKVASIIGDDELEQKVIKIQENIKRDIVFQPSLYTIID
ncbi:ATP dependent ATP helicase [Spraguea lophii 42_110]|uniref:ATP dependent ATP helicase n=1 Tax=Spraguea lophii (strain 42_110) TaxID=1358809 RepID=S7XUP9_SPRLO|nr:ATP dependent ATP helicase [Spraguea lophii 42_110]